MPTAQAVAEDFRRCLVEGDAMGLARLFARTHPHLPAPANELEAVVQLHLARSRSESVPEALRLASRAWLTKEGFPAGV